MREAVAKESNPEDAVKKDNMTRMRGQDKLFPRDTET